MAVASLKQVVDVLETLYPLRYAEDWDAPGLIVGSLESTIETIAFAVDPTMKTIDEAISRGVDLLICHHPLFFRAVHSVAGTGPRGAIVGKLYRNGCALWVGHTNADVAYRGVAQAAADSFGLTGQRPLVPIDNHGMKHAIGMGRVGVLPEPLTLREFAQHVAAVLPHTELGIQVGGDLDAQVRTVAVLPGSGDSLFDQVRASGADVYVTSDLRHHPATDALEQARYEAYCRSCGIQIGAGDARPRPALISTPHSAIESLWFRYAIEDVPAAVAQATSSTPGALQLAVATDPWALSIRN